MRIRSGVVATSIDSIGICDKAYSHKYHHTYLLKFKHLILTKNNKNFWQYLMSLKPTRNEQVNYLFIYNVFRGNKMGLSELNVH